MDNGCGMSEAVKQPHVRAVFHHQARGQRHRPGLPVVLGIVEALGGAIAVHSVRRAGHHVLAVFPRGGGTQA
jgi:sensor histidine kinase regulating citrate/malate metabolism